MTLLDQYGKQIKQGKPVLDEIGGALGLRDRYSTYPSRGLTPERLTDIFREADGGDVLRQTELFEEMEEKDAHLSSVLQTRKLAVAGLQWDVTPASEDSRDADIAAFVRETLGCIQAFDVAMVDMLDFVGKGYSVTEIMWALEAGRVVVSALNWIHAKRFTFAAPDLTVAHAPRLLTEAAQTYGEELVPDKFIVLRNGGRSTTVPRAGVLRPCAWMYLFKNYTLKDWVIFNERFAMPMRLGKYAPGASEQERKVLRNAVFNLGSDAAAVISESTVIELLESSGKSSSAQIYGDLTDYCDRALSKAVLGQTLTTDQVSGTFATAKVHEIVRQDILAADKAALERAINIQLVRPLVAYNFGPDAALPHWGLLVKATEDLKSLAETFTGLASIGVRLPASYLRSKFGVPDPEEGEETVGGPAPAPIPVTQTAAKAPQTVYKLGETANAARTSSCACGQPHGPNEKTALVRMSMSSADDYDAAWAEEYMTRLAPALQTTSDDAVRAVADWVGSLDTPLSKDEFETAAIGLLGGSYASMDTSAVRGAVEGMYKWYQTTGGLAPTVDFGFGGADVRAVEALSELDSFYLSKFVTNPDAYAAMRDFLGDRYLQQGEGIFGAGDPSAIAELKNLMSRKLTELSTAQVSRIVDTGVQRIRNWANLGQLYKAGAVEIEIVEPTRDCDFCKSMHGRIVSVAAAYDTMQRHIGMSASEYEAELKANTPTVENAEDFVSAGLLPPYHPYCHGRIRKRLA